MTQTQGTALRSALAGTFAPRVRILLLFLLLMGVSHRFARDICRIDRAV